MMMYDEVSMYPMVPLTALVMPLQSGLVPDGGRDEIFQTIFVWFLILGTIVGVVVIGYMLYNAYKFRDRGERDDDDGIDRPELGELPEGGGGGRKLALSLLLSAAIVISLITWTYFALVDVETRATQTDDSLNVQVEGFQFGWEFIYPNGNTSETLRVPANTTVQLTVTSRDVFHNFGIPAFKMKTDALPGQTTDTWFQPNETGTYQAQCFELCGAGHSAMNANVSVMEPDAYEQWYENTTPANTTGNATTNATTDNATATNATTGNATTANNATAATNGTTAA